MGREAELGKHTCPSQTPARVCLSGQESSREVELRSRWLGESVLVVANLVITHLPTHPWLDP